MAKPLRPDPFASAEFICAEGGCACGAVRDRLDREPMFVHCCHCTRCQRETGGPLAHHAMVEFNAMTLLQGQPAFVQVPTDSGNRHSVARCALCQTALWNESGSRHAVTRSVRVGTLDQASRLAPGAHIYARSRQAWLQLNDAQAPVFDQPFDAATTWPAASLARCAQAKAAKAAKAATVVKAATVAKKTRAKPQMPSL